MKTFSEDIIKQLLLLGWNENEENSQTNSKIQNLLNFGWNFVRKLYATVNELNEIVKNNIEYNRTAKEFYKSGLGAPFYKDVDKYKILADRIFPLAQSIANELKETSKLKKYKLSFREYLLDVYDIFQSRGINDSIQQSLNEKLWTKENTLKPEIKKKIEQVVDKFKEWLNDINISININDVIIIGSNASYNYNSKSDLDIHIIVDCNNDIMLKLYDAYKTMFNDTYNIKFKNINVELYVQNSIDELYSKGIYSIYNGWIKEPNKEEMIEIDISNEIKSYINKYNNLLEKPSLKGISNLIDKIYELRKSGLETNGEYSKENQIFKEFRKKGYLDKLKTLKTILEGENMSIKDDDSEIEKWKNKHQGKMTFKEWLLNNYKWNIVTFSEKQEGLKNAIYREYMNYLNGKIEEKETKNMRFNCRAYYDVKFKGLEDEADFNDFTDAKNWLWEKSQDGFAVCLKDYQTGVKYEWLTIDDPEQIVIEGLSYNKIEDTSINDEIKQELVDVLIDTDNYVEKDGIFFAKPKDEIEMFEKAYLSGDNGKTWYHAYINHDSNGRIKFQAGPNFVNKYGKRPQIYRNVLTYYANKGPHHVDENMQIDHIKEGNRTDDRLDNLKPLTAQENKAKYNAWKKEQKQSQVTDERKFTHLDALLNKLNAPEIIDGEEYDSLFDFTYRIVDDRLEIFDKNEAYHIDYAEDMNWEMASVAEEFGAEFNGYEDHIYDDIEKVLKQDGFDEVLEWENNVVMSILLPKKYLKDTEDVFIQDLKPRKDESKKDFISRFMKETKKEYPDYKQRLAVAYSYWENK